MNLFEKNIIFKVLTFFVICSLLLILLPSYSTADTTSKLYSVIIADQNGTYSLYDLNAKEGEAGIEINSVGNIMVPLKKLCKVMPHIIYRYDSKKKQATVENTYNGKKVVYTRNSKELIHYSSSKSKGAKKNMTYKMYVSGSSSSVMVHISSLKWVMGTTNGYQYYKVKDMQAAGYDTFLYSGLIVYHPYAEVKEIPKVNNVNGISNIVKVTIPEGYSVAQIFDLLVKKGICTTTDLLYETMRAYDFSYYPLVSQINENENRCFRLEGYLYPDTYEFYRLSRPQDVIGKFLRNAEVKLTEEDRKKAEELGYTVDEILTIASLIEKEVGDPKIMPFVSSVIHNRLNKPMKLQLDASIYYVERYIKPYIDGDINRYNDFYNTYKCVALPTGPICNPGKHAIQAALYPEETNYFFFLSDAEGKYHFSDTYMKLADYQSQETE